MAYPNDQLHTYKLCKDELGEVKSKIASSVAYSYIRFVSTCSSCVLNL